VLFRDNIEVLKILSACQDSLTRLELVKDAKNECRSPEFYEINRTLVYSIKLTETQPLEVFAVNSDAELFMKT
jgi:hypothetical protein